MTGASVSDWCTARSTVAILSSGVWYDICHDGGLLVVVGAHMSEAWKLQALFSLNAPTISGPSSYISSPHYVLAGLVLLFLLLHFSVPRILVVQITTGTRFLSVVSKGQPLSTFPLVAVKILRSTLAHSSRLSASLVCYLCDPNRSFFLSSVLKKKDSHPVRLGVLSHSRSPTEKNSSS